MTSALDLRHVNKGAAGLLAFVTKGEAQRAARARGWLASDVSLAANRFGEYWIICQQISTDVLRVVSHDGIAEVEFRGYR